MTDGVSKPLVNIDEVETIALTSEAGFEAEVMPPRKLIGGDKLRCMLHRVRPGKTAFPFHVHHANEELFIVMSGSGEYRFGDDRCPIRAGDVMAAPVGGADHAHQTIATGNDALIHLGVSTMLEPEVVEYPDSKKFTVFSHTQDGSPMTARLGFVGRSEMTLDYWDGESA